MRVGWTCSCALPIATNIYGELKMFLFSMFTFSCIQKVRHPFFIEAKSMDSSRVVPSFHTLQIPGVLD